jgi:hypothetical protein
MNSTPSSKRFRWFAVAAVISIASMSPAATVLNFSDFSSVAGLQLNGNAAKVGNVLRVTPSLPGQSGSVFSVTPVALTSQVSFSTYFSFRISNPGGIGDGDGQGADGLVFVVQTNANNVGGAGGGIGYQGLANSVGVEFDTYDNGPSIGDPNGNHIAIDTSGNLGSPLGVTALPTNAANLLNNGSIWYAWVDYNGPTDLLEVRLSSASIRPAAAIASATVDLTTILGSTNAFVGFTSGTGAGYNDHDVLSWDFRDDFSPVTQPPVQGVPDSGSSVVIFGLGLSTLAVAGRLRRGGRKTD